MHGRVDVPERPLVGGNLTVGVHVPLAQEKDDLLLGEFRVDAGQRDHVEREVPRGVPGILPLVRHRDDVPVVKVRPGGVAAVLAPRGGRRLRRVPLEPVLDGEVKELLGPEEPRVRLPRDAPLLLRQAVGNAGRVERVGFGPARGEGAVEPGAEGFPRRSRIRTEAQADDDLPFRGDFQPIERGRLRPRARRIDGVAAAADDVLVEGVLDVWRRVWASKETRGVRLVLREEELRRDRRLFDEEPEPAHALVIGRERAAAPGDDGGLAPVAFAGPSPGPRVAEPEGREEIQPRRLRTAIGDRDPDEHVVRRRLGVFHEDVEVAVGLEHARVGELELGVVSPAPPVFLDEPPVRELRLRVLVQRLHVRVRRRRIEIEVALLDVLAVVAFRPAQAEEPLLQNRVAPVPQGDREAEPPFPITQAEQAVFAPAVRAAARVVVREIVPGRPVLGVILADRSPLPLGEIGPPALPVALPPRVLFEPLGLGRLRGDRLDRCCRTFRRLAHGFAAYRMVSLPPLPPGEGWGEGAPGATAAPLPSCHHPMPRTRPTFHPLLAATEAEKAATAVSWMGVGTPLSLP